MKILKIMTEPYYSAFTFIFITLWITQPRFDFIFAPLTFLSWIVTDTFKSEAKKK